LIGEWLLRSENGDRRPANRHLIEEEARRIMAVPQAVGAYDWLVNSADWCRDEKAFRSHSFMDAGKNGPCSNMLREEGYWNTEHGDREHWALFRLAEEYELVGFEVTAQEFRDPPGKAPRECLLQVPTGDGMWETLVRWEGPQSGSHEVSFSPRSSREWRLVIQSSWGAATGACVKAIRFKGCKASAAGRSGPLRSEEHVLHSQFVAFYLKAAQAPGFRCSDWAP